MNDQLHDPVQCASAALACARRIRAHAGEAAAGDGRDIEMARSLESVMAALRDPDGFADTRVDDLRNFIATVEARVLAGTTIGLEVHDAWTERGVETTTVRPVEEMTAEAGRLAIVLADLRRLAGLIEATVDLVAAEAIVATLRRRCQAIRGIAQTAGRTSK